METLKKIWEWITKHPSFILISIVIILIILLLNDCASDAKKDKINEQNIFALNDSVRKVKNKVGELEYQKGILITDKKHLEELNADLAKELEKEKGNVKIITKEVIKFVHDTIFIKDTVYPEGNGIYKVAWKYDTVAGPQDYVYINGSSRIKVDTTGNIVSVTSLGTKIYPYLSTSVVRTISKEKGKLVMNTRFGNPWFQTAQMDGAVLDDFKEFQKYKRFGVGPQIGVGFGSNLDLVIYIGLGIHYDIFRF